jgi:hypothetical protein
LVIGYIIMMQIFSKCPMHCMMSTNRNYDCGISSK